MDKREEMLEELKKSKVYMAIVTENFLKDPVTALQLGFAIFLDKPIFLLAVKDVMIPKNLIKIATCVERINSDNSEEMKRASEKFARMVIEL